MFSIGTLAVGETATLTLEGTVDAGAGGNTITNITTAASGDQIDPSTVGDDLDEAVVVDNIADLVTVKALVSGDATPEEGDTVTFSITVTNNGAAQATNVSLSDLLPEGLTATALNGGVTQGSYDASTGLFSIGTLAVGESAILTLEGTVDVGAGGNTITNITTAATGDQVDPSTLGDDLDEAVAVNVPPEPPQAALIAEVPVAFIIEPEPEEVRRRTAVLSDLFINADGVVGDTVNELSSLSGISSDELLLGAALPDPTHDLILSGHETQISEGFSSGKGYRGTHSVDPTDECGRVFVDTINEASGLSITVRSTIDPTISDGVTGFTVTLANGEPLPQWISEIGDGELLLDRSGDVEVVALKIVSHRDGASDLIRHVEIDTLTGQIREQQQAGTFGSSFYETIDTAVNDE